MEREIKSREREKEEEKREGGSGRIRKEREDFGNIRKKGFLKRRKLGRKRTCRKHPKERENFSEKEEKLGRKRENYPEASEREVKTEK